MRAEVLDAHGILMLPAMTDIHTHMVQSLTKGPLDDLNITEWLKNATDVLGYRELGRLREGCIADFSLVRKDGIGLTNERRILNNLLYSGSSSAVDSVFVNGEAVLQNGAFVHHDLGQVLEKCEQILH